MNESIENSCDDNTDEECDGKDEISLNLSTLSLKTNSSDSTSSYGSTFCRICHQNASSGTGNSEMVSPCNCMGSMANVHQQCLQRWASLSSSSCCDICGFKYRSRKKYPTIWTWFNTVIFTKEFTVELVITSLMAISTPLILMATILSALVRTSGEGMEPLVYSLWSITIFSWILYTIMLICTVRYLKKSFNDWKEKNLVIELVWSEDSEECHQNCGENYI